jgi:hypothetical protein
MGETCSLDGGDEKCVQNFGLGSLKGIEHSEVLGVGGRMILK